MTNSMRFAALATLASAAALLAACGSSDTVEAENESVESVAQKVAKSDIKPNPGRWETQVSIDKVEIPGMPPEMQSMMKSQMGKIDANISCLTQEQVDAGDGEMFKPGENSGCTYDTFSMGGGELDAVMTCKEGPMQQTMKMAGTYSDNSYDMTINAEGTVDGKPMNMAMSIKSKRLGECDGSEQG